MPLHIPLPSSIHHSSIFFFYDEHLSISFTSLSLFSSINPSCVLHPSSSSSFLLSLCSHPSISSSVLIIHPSLLSFIFLFLKLYFFCHSEHPSILPSSPFSSPCESIHPCFFTSLRYPRKYPPSLRLLTYPSIVRRPAPILDIPSCFWLNVLLFFLNAGSTLNST